MDSAIIRIQHISRTFGLKKALDDVSFDVPAGAVVALIGPNGAGKSTLLRIAAALLRPSDGDIKMDGVSVVRNPREVHRRIGFLPDFFGLYDDLKVKEFCEYFCRAYRVEIDQRAPVIRRVLEQSGLAQQSEEPIKHLSRGMRQRLGIARALIPDPVVLLLDEPTAGIDPDLRVGLQQLFQDLAQAGKTLIVSSHLLQELEDYCSHVAILNAAQLAAYGTLEQVRQRIRPGLWVLIRTEKPDERVPEILARIAGVKNITGHGTEFRFSFEGADSALHNVLQAVVQAGIPIIHFGEEKKSMHDTYFRTLHGKSVS